MPWGKFSKDFSFRRSRHSMTSFLAGKRYLVDAKAVEAAAAVGVTFEETPRPEGAPAQATGPGSRRRNAGGGV